VNFSVKWCSINKWVFRIIFLAGIIWLAACAPSATPGEPPAATEAPVPVEVVKTVEVVVTEVVEVVVTETPAITTSPSRTPPPPKITPLPSIPPQPAATAEERLVHLEWPLQMRLGDSDVVRLSLVPSEEGYLLESEFPEHQVETQQLQVERQSGYNLWAIARLDGVNFAISPTGDQAQYLPEGESTAWSWSLMPQDPGQQRLTVSLWLRWEPVSPAAAPPRQTMAYTRGLEVRVLSFFGLTRGQAMSGGIGGLLLGGSLCLFALLVIPRPPLYRLDTSLPNPELVIETGTGINLSEQDRQLLQVLFRLYGRLVVQSEFHSGYSGARTFLALPLRPDGRSDAYSIIKIGPTGDIQREYQNHEQFVKETLPPMTARIQHPPVTLSDRSFHPPRAALRYTFIADPGHMPLSLRQALLQKPSPELFNRLFDTFGPNWWMQRHPQVFRLGVEYDRLLPAHYTLEPAQGHGRVLDGRMVPDDVSLGIGDLASLRNFPEMELRSDGTSYSIKSAVKPGQPCLRLRWLGAVKPDGATGRVVATRLEVLRGITADFILHNFPDPLSPLASLLDLTIQGTYSTIHGDLNLENILVGPGEFVWLVDFAETREGHPLYDFAHLHADLLAHVICPQLASPLEYQAYLNGTAQYDQGFQLEEALREMAARCLFDPAKPAEYELALYFACLGTLKYVNLSTVQKYFLYLAAARALSSLQASPLNSNLIRQ